MLFYSFFSTLVDKQSEVVVELKNNLEIRGVLHSVDQFLNVKLNNAELVDKEGKFPHLTAVKNCFVRGSVIRFVRMHASDVDVDLLQDATRREYRDSQQAASLQSGQARK